ncbi:MAG TPA: hypothetical protein VGG01_16495 [Xanthobacteraceae bacterium]|jgi:hypothetical protein
MTPIAGISATSMIGAAGGTPRQDLPSPREPKMSSSRSLIALQAVPAGEAPLRTHPDARFLAHLIATDQKVPQTRERRRAEPEVATMAYAAANAEPAVPAGLRLFRVM